MTITVTTFVKARTGVLKFGSKELDRREVYKLHRHKDPTSAASNKTLPRVVLTLLPVSET
jgi:hypothetical protein